LPVLDAVTVREHLAVLPMVVADVDRRHHVRALDDDVAVRHLAVALIVSAVDEEARRLIDDVRVLHYPDRIAVHEVARLPEQETACPPAQQPCSNATIRKPGSARVACCRWS